MTTYMKANRPKDFAKTGVKHLLKRAGSLVLEATELAKDDPESLEYIEDLLSDWQGAIIGSLEEVGYILITDRENQ